MIAVKKEPASPAPTTTATIERKSVALSLLVDSPLNPRKTFDKKRLDELAASMKAMGQLQPILVRPSKAKAGFYEIASGHRRRRAADLAGIESLEAVVRDLTDEQVIIIGLTEDQNEPLPPLEEAAGYKALKDRGWTVEQIADEAGKSVAVVRKRLRLTHLHADVQKAVRERWLLPGAAALFARLESLDEQAVALEQLGKARPESPFGAEDVEYVVNQRMRRLADAPFDTKDAQLVAKAGACTTCAKRTQAQATLFNEAPDDEDMCTDGACYASKVEAQSLVVIEKAKAKGQRVVEDPKKEKIVNEHGRLDYAYAPLDEKYYGNDGKQTTRRATLKKAGVEVEPVVVVVSGVAQEVVPRKVVEKAEKAISKSETGGGRSDFARQRDASDKAKGDIAALLLSSLRRVKTLDAPTMRAAFALAASHASFESVKRACFAWEINTQQPDVALLIKEADRRNLTAVEWLRLLVEVSFPVSHINALGAAKEAVKLFGLDPKKAIDDGGISMGNEQRALRGTGPMRDDLRKTGDAGVVARVSPLLRSSSSKKAKPAKKAKAKKGGKKR